MQERIIIVYFVTFLVSDSDGTPGLHDNLVEINRGGTK